MATMIKVTVGSNSSKNDVIVSSAATPKTVLTQNGVKYERAQVFIDGVVATTDMMNTTLEELGYKPTSDGSSSGYIIAVVKADSARLAA